MTISEICLIVLVESELRSAFGYLPEQDSRRQSVWTWTFSKWMNSRWTSGLSITQQRSENSDNSLRFIRQKIIQRKTLPHSAISRLNSFFTRLKNFLILELLRLSNLFSQQIQTHCYDVLNIPFLMNHKRPHRLWLIDLGVLKWPQIDPEFDHLLLKILLGIKFEIFSQRNFRLSTFKVSVFRLFKLSNLPNEMLFFMFSNP